MIVVVAALKGGVGKTTTSVYLSAVVASNKRSATLVDADPQGSAADWIETAEDESFERVTLVEAPTERMLTKALGRIDGEDVAIVDTPPGSERLLAKAIEAADAIVIPTRIGGVEIARVEAVLDLVPRQLPVGLVICSAADVHPRLPGCRRQLDRGRRPGVGERAGAGRDRRRSRGVALGRRARVVPQHLAEDPARRARGLESRPCRTRSTLTP